MSEAQETLAELRQQEYELRVEASRLRREVYEQVDPSAHPKILEELIEAEGKLQEVEVQVGKAVAKDKESGLILDFSQDIETHRRMPTTGLEAKVHLRMAQVPSSFYHLLDPQGDPLISCEVAASDENDDTKRVRVTSFIEGYSAQAVNTFELDPGDKHSFKQLPPLFLGSIADLNELTRASLNILVEDLDTGKAELHESYPIWLLARTTAPLAVRDPKTGRWRDMTRYLGAFVTPNARSLMRFLRAAAELHPRGRLVGYQVGKEEVTSQVKAIFDALKQEADITYVNSVIDHTPEDGFSGQRVRLPKESLEEKQANCIDGTVLFASLLEGVSINPAIVLVPGHAFLAWETWRNSGEWKYLETTMIGTSTFEQACKSAESTYQRYKKVERATRLSLNELRTKHGVWPME
jgi:hypothetical protein